ncbi:ABC transporter permease [Shouchella miscanthi]|uniref:ABC transporter permease n=1 Tax=Shouchella miscanthi TaxID=2598861 RepID=UPI0011A05897|nr:ABC transporter permease [Shouchella miscanthi]
MYRLIKLELKKHKIGWYIKGTLIANASILAMLYFFTVIEKLENDVIFQTSDEFFMFTGVLIRGTFIIFASVLITKIVIDEFKHRTSLVLFSYPINRKKLIVAKLVLIFSLTFIMMTLSTLFIVASFTGLNAFIGFSANLHVTQEQLLQELLRLIGFNVAAAGTSLVPLYFGMRHFSTPATILSAVLIVIVTSSSLGPQFSLINIFYIPLALAFIGLIIACVSIQTINRLELNEPV